MRWACRPVLYANMGGPMSRVRTEHLASTLLGRDEGAIRCPRVIRLGLSFSAADGVGTLERLLAEAGYADPESLRGVFAIPEKRLICRPLPPDAKRLSVGRCSRAAVLHQALMLGLCTAQLYDPARPVLWTESSLGRGLELFDMEGFYS
jgi:hypothetical protein